MNRGGHRRPSSIRPGLLSRQRGKIPLSLLHLAPKRSCWNLHPTEGKPFLSQIFERSPDVVHGVVNAKEPVVRLRELVHFNWRILRVVFQYIGSETWRDTSCVDNCFDAIYTLVQHSQCRVIHIAWRPVSGR